MIFVKGEDKNRILSEIAKRKQPVRTTLVRRVHVIVKRQQNFRRVK